MNTAAVSLHPYFRVHPGKLAAARELLPRFVAKTRSEPDCLAYSFTQNGEEIFCREAYTSGEGVLRHLQNVDAELKEMLALADVTRIEVHGPAAEVAKLKEPLGGLNPAWFELVCGI